MIKFKITPVRFAEACNILEYLTATSDAPNRQTLIRIAPRFILNGDGEYLVKVILDEDGDIKEFENMNEAFLKMSGVTPKRLEKLINEFTEAAKAIVNPQNGEGLNTPMSMDTEKPPPG